MTIDSSGVMCYSDTRCNDDKKSTLFCCTFMNGNHERCCLYRTLRRFNNNISSNYCWTTAGTLSFLYKRTTISNGFSAQLLPCLVPVTTDVIPLLLFVIAVISKHILFYCSCSNIMNIHPITNSIVRINPALASLLDNNRHSTPMPLAIRQSSIEWPTASLLRHRKDRVHFSIVPVVQLSPQRMCRTKTCCHNLDRKNRSITIQ